MVPFLLCALSDVHGSSTILQIRQYEMMLRCLMVDEAMNPNQVLRSMFMANSVKFSEDVCTWLGVCCHELKVQSVILEKRHALNILLCHWLPPTTEIVHLKSLSVYESVRSELLPRALLYLCLDACHNTGSINLRNLPLKMLEFHSIHCRAEGTLDLTELPPQMKRITFINAKYTALYISALSLPESIEQIVISKGLANMHVVWTERNETDERLSISASFEKVHSDDYAFCESEIERSRDQVMKWKFESRAKRKQKLFE